MPNHCKNLTKTAIVFIFLYFSGIGCDVLLGKIFLNNSELTAKDAAKITLHHFSQPNKNIFMDLDQLRKFLDQVVKEKTGILSQKPFYLSLMVLVIGLSATVFGYIGRDLSLK